MHELDKQVARRLTRFYVIALAVVALLSVSGLLFIRHTLHNHYDDSRVVNVAGLQRMLSQRLTKLALLKTQQLPAVDAVQFDSLLKTWSQNQEQLQSGMLRMEKRYAVRKSARLDSMFAHIEPVFQAMHGNFSRLASPQTPAPVQRAALGVILQNEVPFLEQMNAIVFQFDTESFGRVQQLERIEWLLAGATLLTLLIEGFFVFRPVVSHTKRIIRRLARSETSLQQANSQLKITNRELALTNDNLAYANQKLRQTRQELMQATEEKYQLQLAEENVRSAALLQGQEDERRRFARELHDGVGQMLTGVKLHAEKLKTTPFADDKNRQRFAELCELIADVIQTTRQVSHNLMPSTLSDFGLGPTLKLLAEQTSRSSGIQVVFSESSDGLRLSPAMEAGLYRIGQESLHNAIKYAGAQIIRIDLQQNGCELLLSVEDDGKGFPVDSREKPPETGRNGLANMQTRARLLNGTLTINSKLNWGTVIRVRIPLAENT